MIRVLHVVGKMNRAGAETMIMNIYRNIDRQKIQFDFLYFTHDSSYYDTEIEKLGGKIFRLTNKNLLSNLIKLQKILKSNPEIKGIHCHTLLSSSFYLCVSYFAKLPLRIVHSHSNKSKEKTGIIYKLYEKFSKIIIDKFATHFVSCSKVATQYLFPFRLQSEVLFLPNAINVEEFFKIGQENKNYLRDLYSLPKETIIILQVGRLSSVKNHSFSIKLAHELNKQEIDFKMFFAGIGEKEMELKNSVKSKNLENKIIFMGERDDVAHLMAASDVMLLPSLYEGLGLVLVEAQTVGLHTIASDQIPDEVDFDLNLITFEKLKINVWMNTLKIIRTLNTMDDFERKKKIIQHGYDAKHSAKLLQNLYISNYKIM